MAVAVVALALAPFASADHIRVMTVYQSGNTGLEVTLHVDYQPSGNCCGGNVYWHTDVLDGAADRVGGPIHDGIEEGCYVGPDSGSGMFVGGNGGTYEWTRYAVALVPQPPPPVECVPNLIRIEITYTYDAPGDYVVQWYDCCPQSGLFTPVVVTGQAVESAPIQRILAFDTSDNVEVSLLQAGFPSCDPSAVAPVCYDLIDPATFANTALFTTAQLDEYDVIYMGANAPTAESALITRALGLTPDLWDWISHGGAVVAYGQGRGSWTWVPNQGDAVSAALALETEMVFLTAKGQAHSSHLNQLPAMASLSNWGPSKTNVFTAWPAYFNTVPANPLTGPLSVDAAVDPNGGAPLPGTNAVSLAGKYASAPTVFGCVFISGQPVDVQAVAGEFYAATLVRSSVHYGLTCDETALILPF